MAQYELKDPTKLRRGRKPVRDDIYISQTLAKLKTMEKQLETEKNTLTPVEVEKLRNKASALRSRLNKKLEQKTFMRDNDYYKAQIDK